MQELIEIVKAARDREHRNHKMAAALKGIDLDKDAKKEAEDPVEASKRRVAKRLAEQQGISEKEFEAKESEKRLQQVGFKVIKN